MKEKVKTTYDSIPTWGDNRRTRIGLLGGSFNPAHVGHAQLAKWALNHLDLHQVWLLVSPGNPFKLNKDMAPLAERISHTRAIADGRHIVATDIESRLGTKYSADTVKLLQQRFPRVNFVWIMGADLLIEMPRWKHWLTLLQMIPIAIVPRPGYNHRALAGKIARRFRHSRFLRRQLVDLGLVDVPAWQFFFAPQLLISSTDIRQRKSMLVGNQSEW